jgi:hypothetical protein
MFWDLECSTMIAFASATLTVALTTGSAAR